MGSLNLPQGGGGLPPVFVGLAAESWSVAYVAHTMSQQE